MKKVLAIIINYGTEIRPFIDSGFYNEISKHYETYIFIKNNSLKKFIDNIPSKNVIYYNLDDIIGPHRFKLKVYSKIDILFRTIRRSRARRMGFGEYHFTKGSNYKRNWYDGLIGCELLYYLHYFIYRKIAGWIYYSSELSSLFSNYHITNLLIYGSNMTEMLFIQHTASKQGLTLWKYIGNWKDIYIDYFTPVIPKFTFVWSTKIKTDLLRLNPYLAEESICVSGNWYFYKFFNAEPYNPKTYYINKYSFDSHKRIILWPMSNRAIFENEYKLLIKVNNYIETLPANKQPTILIRENAFGLLNEYIHELEKLKHIRIMENFWHLSRQEDFIVQSSLGELEWFDILYWCDLIVSTPSTIALESILMGKNYINILFDENGKYSKKLAAFSAAPFYKELLHRPDVILVENIEGFLSMLLDIENIVKKHPSVLPEIIDGNKYSDLNTVVNIFLK